MWTKIRVGTGRSGLAVYAGITYFYRWWDVRALWFSYRHRGEVITPYELRELVGRPFTSRYGKMYELMYDLETGEKRRV